MEINLLLLFGIIASHMHRKNWMNEKSMRETNTSRKTANEIKKKLNKIICRSSILAVGCDLSRIVDFIFD